MFWCQWLSVVVRSEHHPRIEKVVDREIGRVPTLAVKHHEASGRPHAGEIAQGAGGHAGPGVPE